MRKTIPAYEAIEWLTKDEAFKLHYDEAQRQMVSMIPEQKNEFLFGKFECDNENEEYEDDGKL